MVFQPTKRGEETMVFSGCPPPVKNTFLHYDVHQGATAVVEAQALRRHQTAPPRAEATDSDSEEETVELPKITGSNPSALLRELKAFVTPPPISKEDCPVPGSLCRHTTHDAFDDSQVWDAPYFAPGHLITEGHNFNENEMIGTGMQVLPEGLQWDGQMGGQSGGVLPMTSSTVMFMGVHPPVWMPEDAANFQQVPMIPLMAQPQTLQLPIDSMEQDQPTNWQNWSPEYYDGQLQVPQQVSDVSQNPEAFETLQSMVLGQPATDFHANMTALPENSFWDGLGVELLHQPQKIGRSANMDHVYWVVDASKLNDKAKVLVSPEFKIPGRDGHQFSFKMVMYPKDKTSFRAAGGQGFVQLKCESDTQDLNGCLLSFRMGICNGYTGPDAKRDGPREAVTWDFKKSLVCDDEEVKKTWNFKDVVDTKTRTFAVCIEILSMEA